jgi:hypothetical protein
MKNKTLTCLNCYVENSTENKSCYFCNFGHLIETEKLIIVVKIDDLTFCALIGPSEDNIFKFAYRAEDESSKIHQEMFDKHMNQQKVNVKVITFDNLNLSFEGVIIHCPQEYYTYLKVEIIAVGDIEISRVLPYSN